MPLWFMRHGETNYNRLGLCNDNPERDVHLSDTGIRQAEQAAEQLRHKLLRRILVSELPRTRQTAEIINRHHQVPIEIYPALNDIQSGFDGRPVAEYFAAISHDPLHARVKGGESLLDHKQRISHFLHDLQSRQEDAVLIVAHEETLRAISVWFQGLPDSALCEQHFNNGEILEYDWP
ncbi:MAG: histidine phosphatase family protein [Gammaproteobacteria bacterium]|nr:histidine phosphatase family protein [Gammaproteobacteria bacterium]